MVVKLGSVSGRELSETYTLFLSQRLIDPSGLYHGTYLLSTGLGAPLVRITSSLLVMLFCCISKSFFSAGGEGVNLEAKQDECYVNI